MTRRIHRAIADWLRHEGARAEDRAESAFARAVAALPRPLPPAHFVESVLLRAGLRPVAVSRDLATWRARALVAVSCALAAMAVLYLPSLIRAAAVGFKPVKLAEVAAGALAGLVQRSAEALKVWEALTRMGEIVSAALASPAWLAALSLAILVSLGAFRLLHHLLLEDRSYRHAGI